MSVCFGRESGRRRVPVGSSSLENCPSQSVATRFLVRMVKSVANYAIRLQTTQLAFKKKLGARSLADLIRLGTTTGWPGRTCFPRMRCRHLDSASGHSAGDTCGERGRHGFWGSIPFVSKPSWVCGALVVPPYWPLPLAYSPSVPTHRKPVRNRWEDSRASRARPMSRVMVEEAGALRNWISACARATPSVWESAVVRPSS